MFDFALRMLKRVAVLLPGIGVTFFAVRNLYPVVDRRIPAGFAILVTYIITAYLLIPAALRLVRLFYIPKHIPLYCTTPDGFASDPVNIGLVGTRDEVLSAMKEAGWFLADARTPRTLLRMGMSILLHKRYPNAPFSNLYLFGRKQDIGFELPFKTNPNHRHHVRFWALIPSTNITHHEHIRFWQKHHSEEETHRLLWIGAASRDIGIRPIMHTAQLTHMIHPDTNAERDRIVQDLQQANMIKSARKITAGKPYRLRNRVLGGYLMADGELTICHLHKLEKQSKKTVSRKASKSTSRQLRQSH